MVDRDLANCMDGPISQVACLGASTRKRMVREGIPDKLGEYFDQRSFWIHDMEYYDLTYNCLGINPSHLIGKSEYTSFDQACRSLFREVIALTNQQSGGIGFIDFDADMGRYVQEESDAELEESLWQFLLDLNTFVRKGYERAYVTLNIGLSLEKQGKRVAHALLFAFSRQQLVFPNIVFKVKQGVNALPEDPNYDLFCHASLVTTQCMNPTYLNMDASFNRDIPASELGIMGCRTRIAANRFHTASSLQRGNIAAVTINLVQLALKSDHDTERFDALLPEIMDRAKDLLLHRLHTLAVHGCFDYVRQHDLYLDSQKDDPMEMLKNGTLSIGFIGLWDALSVLCEIDTTSLDVLRTYQDKALQIVRMMRQKTDEYACTENLNFSLLASSAEGVTGYFSQYDAQHYSHAAAVCAKGHYTNSFHVPVECMLNCFDKIDLEAPFHALCNGGQITYVELSELPLGNPNAIRELVNYACARDMGYFGINFPLDICNNCGKKGSFFQQCPDCASTDIRRLRRVSGYLSDTNTFTNGKKNELLHRRAHVGVQLPEIKATPQTPH